MSCQTSTTTKRRAGCFHTSLNTEAHKIISPFPLQYQVDERYAPEYPPIWAVVSSRPNGGLLQAVNNSLSRQKSQMERPPSSLHAFIISYAFARDHGSHETRGPEERSRQSNIDQKKVTALGVALRKFSGGTNLPEVETLKINRELNELSRCHDENCRVVEK